ncbi:MAG: hypothetical protein EOR84_33055 [Mesorhizobium sp.]|nr:MAG: hypothetical protein EOR84_33055 [Mesorhizobium sp.]
MNLQLGLTPSGISPSPRHDRTVTSTGKGERWFCSEAEARAAGWRKARRWRPPCSCPAAIARFWFR